MVARHCVLAGYNPIHMVSLIGAYNTSCDINRKSPLRKLLISFCRQSGLFLSSGFIHDWKEDFNRITMNKMAAKDEAVPWVLAEPGSCVQDVIILHEPESRDDNEQITPAEDQFRRFFGYDRKA